MKKVKNKQRKTKLASKHGLHNIKRNQARLKLRYKERCLKERLKREEKQKFEAA